MSQEPDVPIVERLRNLAAVFSAISFPRADGYGEIACREAADTIKELVEALRRTNKVARALARGHAVFPGDVAALDASDALLAKTELNDPASDMRDSCGATPVSEGGKR